MTHSWTIWHQHGAVALLITLALGCASCATPEQPSSEAPERAIGDKPATAPVPDQTPQAQPLEPRLEFGGHVRKPLDSHVVRDQAGLEALVEKVPVKQVTKKHPSPDNDDPLLDEPDIDFAEEMLVVAACPTFYCTIEFVGLRTQDDRHVVVVSLPGEGEKAEYHARPAGIGHYRALVVPRVDGDIAFEYRGPGQRP